MWWFSGGGVVCMYVCIFGIMTNIKQYGDQTTVRLALEARTRTLTAVILPDNTFD